MSIDSQIHELQALAARRGIRIGEVLTEAQSAKAPGRPIFGDLMRRIRRGEIAGVLCWKMDRLARNHMDTGALLQALADEKLAEVVTSDRTYTRDGNDRFMGGFELGMATKYIDDLRANVRRGNRARLARGWINHNPPLGYLLDPVSKTIIRDPDRFDLVRRMWELILTGTMRPTQVLHIANNEWGLRTRRFKRIGGKPLSRSLFFRMLGHPFYMGVIRLRNGETFPGAHPSMVSREEFEHVQQLLGRPGRERPKRHQFPFAGFIKCGACGGTVTAEEHVKPSGKRYVYYHCSRRKAGVTCREPAIPGPVLEDQITQRLQQLSLPSGVMQWVTQHVQIDLARDDERWRAVRATIEKTLTATQREGETLLDLRLRDLMSDDDYAQRKRAIDERVRSLQAKITAPERTPEQIGELTLKTFDFAAHVVQRFRAGTRVQKRMILEATGSNYVLGSRKLLLQAKEPFRTIADSRSGSNWSATVDAVRTWIQDTTEFFKLPDLDAARDMDTGP